MKTIASFAIAMALLFGMVSNSRADNQATTGLYKTIQDLLVGSNYDSAAMASGIIAAYIDEDKGNNIQNARDIKNIASVIAHYYERNPAARDMDQRELVITALKEAYPAKNAALKGVSPGLGATIMGSAYGFYKQPAPVRVAHAVQGAVYDSALFGYYVGVRNAENFIIPDEDNNMKNICNVILQYIETHPESVYKSDRKTALPNSVVAPGVVIKALEARYRRG